MSVLLSDKNAFSFVRLKLVTTHIALARYSYGRNQGWRPKRRAEIDREVTGLVIPSEQKRLREEGLDCGNSLKQRSKSAGSHTGVANVDVNERKPDIGNAQVSRKPPDKQALLLKIHGNEAERFARLPICPGAAR
jgi:hypothetical protein